MSLNVVDCTLLLSPSSPPTYSPFDSLVSAVESKSDRFREAAQQARQLAEGESSIHILNHYNVLRKKILHRESSVIFFLPLSYMIISIGQVLS